MLRNYLKVALKVLLRRKIFTGISLFAISFTLMVLMLAAAFLDHFLGAIPPEIHGDRTLGVFHAHLSGPHSRWHSQPGFLLLDRCAKPLSGAERVSIHQEPAKVASYRNGERIPLYLKRTDGEFWQIFEFRFLEGRPFTPEDERDASFVAVINEATRTRLFGSTPAVGRTLEIDGQRFRVVGVVRNVPIFRMIPFSDVWVPISTAKTDSYRRELVGGFMATILARSRSDLPAIRREFRERVGRIELPDRKVYDRLDSEAETFPESVAADLLSSGAGGGGPAALLAIAVGLGILFMTLPALNLVNLNVSRILERAPEIGVRKAFGASRRSLAGQFIVENLVLCLAGGVVGFALSWIALEAFSASGLVPYAQFRLNVRIFLYGLATTAFFGVFSGALPAWRMSRLHPVAALRGRMR